MGRGMKKWAPYKALTEQYESLYTLEKAKSRIALNVGIIGLLTLANKRKKKW